ncbi:MAG: hypothetical protein RL011_1536 [Pseudomonadota bacterium]
MNSRQPLGLRPTLTACLTVGALLLQSCGASTKHEAIDEKSTTSNPLSGDVADGDDSQLNLAHQNGVLLLFSFLRHYTAAVRIQRKADISYPVCLAVHYPIVNDERGERLESVKVIMNEWNKLLKRDPTWPVASITPYLVGSTTSCPWFVNRLPVLKILGTTTLVPFSDKTAAGMTYPFMYQTNLHKDVYNKPDDFRRVMRHEYGHLLGLGDTYTHDGYQAPTGQPDSVMQSARETFTQDDIDAVLHLWTRISGRSRNACPSGYIESGSTIMASFCVKPRPVFTGRIVTASNKCLAVEGGYSAQGVRIMQTDCDGNANQRFTLLRGDNGSYQIRPEYNQQCLDIAGASRWGGARLIQWGCHGKTNQNFTVRKAQMGHMNIINVNSNKCIDIPRGSTANGVSVIQWGCNNGTNQLFRFEGYTPQE